MPFTAKLGSPGSRLANMPPGNVTPAGNEQTGTWQEAFRGIVWQEVLRGLAWQEVNRALSWQEAARAGAWQETIRSNRWSAPIMATLTKRAGETRLYTMDLSLLPEIVGGDTVASVNSVNVATSTPGAQPSDLTITNIAVSASPANKGAQCKVAGGIDGATYQLSFAVTTAANYLLVGIGYIYIDDR
jgi:hypothetical protein